jgi:PilZ domain
LSVVNHSVSAAIEQQRMATEEFGLNARETNRAAIDVASRLAEISGLLSRSQASASEFSVVACDMRESSRAVCSTIPDIVRKAVKADLREHPRYEIDLMAVLEWDGQRADVRVFEVSEGGACIERVPGLAAGDAIALTFKALNPIAGELVRDAGGRFGVCFSLAPLRLEELRELVTVPVAA